MINVANRDSVYIDLFSLSDAGEGAMPVFAKPGVLYKDTSYFRKMYDLYHYTKTVRSRGNGWVLAALVSVLSILPQNDPHRSEYLGDYLDMIRALTPLQRADGFWNVSLHDFDAFRRKGTFRHGPVHLWHGLGCSPGLSR